MEKIFFIAEIGINHNGDMDIAKELIKRSKQTGFNAVKFQKRTIEKVYSKKFWINQKILGQNFKEIKEGLEFNYDQYKEIDEYCKSLGIEWFASAWDLDSLTFLTNSIQLSKITSAMIVD